MASDDATLEAISEMRMQKARINHEAYKELWNQCSRVIMYNARQDLRWARFVVTPWVVGKPLVDTTRAARYIADKLNRRGFRLVQADNRPPFVELWIEWDDAPDPKKQIVKPKPPVAAEKEPEPEPKKEKTETELIDEVMALIARKTDLKP
jgi:hypothetical protein